MKLVMSMLMALLMKMIITTMMTMKTMMRKVVMMGKIMYQEESLVLLSLLVSEAQLPALDTVGEVP